MFVCFDEKHGAYGYRHFDSVMELEHNEKKSDVEYHLAGVEGNILLFHPVKNNHLC